MGHGIVELSQTGRRAGAQILQRSLDFSLARMVSAFHSSAPFVNEIDLSAVLSAPLAGSRRVLCPVA
jgi:hypothetical protein